MSAPYASSVLLFAAVWCCVAAPARAADATPLRLSIAICAPGQVLPELVAGAERVAEDVYRDIGVAIDWSDDQCGAGEASLQVNIITRDRTGEPVSEETIGFAEPGAAVATVLYDRVVTFSRRCHVKRELLLGYAMAHEIGHLLLGPHSHSSEGLMRVSLNLKLAAARQLWFSKPQGELIVRRLASARAVVATR